MTLHHHAHCHICNISNNVLQQKETSTSKKAPNAYLQKFINKQTERKLLCCVDGGGLGFASSYFSLCK